MKPWVALVVGCLAGLLLAQTLRGRTDAGAILRADSLQTRLQTLELQGRADSALSTAREDSISRLIVEVARLTASRPVVRGRTDTLVTLVPDTGPRDSLMGAIRQERAVSDSVVEAYRVIVGLVVAQRDTLRADRDRWRDLCQEYNRQLQEAVRRPGPHSKWVDAGLAAGGFVAGHLLK